ncbi:hypothetical protein LUZ60_012545 [Juncus effusus]|nr:hypothetical protein LUZ60_012545 [Juncus effusus]
MEEGEVGAQIRVVRCPKCEKLLPEMPNYSVYLCGNCGATLQAKKLNRASDSSPEKSDGENVKYLEILDSQSDKKKNPSPNLVNTLTETDNQTKNLQPIIHKESPPLESPVKSTSNSFPLNSNSNPSIHNPSFTQNNTETNQTKYRRTHKTANTNSVQSKESIRDEGPSDYSNNPNPNPQIETLEQDRANLLRMLEEIRDQVQKSCEISGKQNPGNLNAGIPVLASRVPEPSRTRSGYNVGIPNYYPHNNNNNNYAWRNPDNYYYAQFEPDPLISYHHEGFYHQPACACLHCFPREVPVPVPVPTHRPVSVPYQLYHQNPFSNPRSSNNSPSLIMRQSNNNRRNFARRNCRQCQPIAGASPFVVCYNCFELLQVPKRSPLCDNKKAQVKLRCGSCSHAMILKLDGNELVVENDKEKENETNVPHFESKFASYNFLLGNYENATGSERSRSEASSKEMENGAVSRVPSLPLREHLSNSFTEKGNISARSEQEKAVLYAENFKQNSVKEVTVVPVPGELVPVPTEMDLSADEYPYPGLSQESFEGGNNEEERQTGTKNGTDNSFFANFFKKSFKGGNNARARVSVNGYVISDKALKKAEKYAGPISPGDYWYDYRCGFWGVMGYHCLGMIPPHIEEFNYPLQRNCAGGNTSVVINGRELHRKDLELLTGRGLPGAPGFSYRVEASGKVWDESTGEELYSLGKLAPTVEKMRRGFGMRVPRVIS